MYTDFLELAFRNILNRRRRSWLTIVGIFIGIAAVVALVALGQGLNHAITGEFEKIGADKVFISPGGNPVSPTSFSQSTATLKDGDLNAIRRTRGVETAAGALMRTTRIHHQDQSAYVTIVGIPPNNALLQQSFSFTIADGRDIRSTDHSGIVIGSRLANDLFDNTLHVRSKLQFAGTTFRVVGVLEPTGDRMIDGAVIMPYDRARDVLATEKSYDQIIARVQPGFTPGEVKTNVERSLRQQRGLKKGEEDFTVSTSADIISSFQNVLSIVQAIVVGIASISLLVGGVGIMNTMYTAVNDRTREIGVMKAIGAQNKHILTIFLFESGMIGLVGGVLGVLTGVGISLLAAYGASQFSSIPLDASLSPTLIGGALLFSFIVGTVSGALPARNAARLNPVDALQYE